MPYFAVEMIEYRKHIFPTLLLGLTILALSSCHKMKEPEPRGIEDLRISRLGLKSSELQLRLLYYNPNHSGVTLKNASGDAWIDSEYAGHFSIDSMVRIHARDDFSLPVSLQLEMNQVLKTSSAILFGKVVDLRLEGNAKIRKGGISFNLPIRYQGKQDLGRMGN